MYNKYRESFDKQNQTHNKPPLPPPPPSPPLSITSSRKPPLHSPHNNNNLTRHHSSTIKPKTLSSAPIPAAPNPPVNVHPPPKRPTPPKLHKSVTTTSSAAKTTTNGTHTNLQKSLSSLQTSIATLQQHKLNLQASLESTNHEIDKCNLPSKLLASMTLRKEKLNESILQMKMRLNEDGLKLGSLSDKELAIRVDKLDASKAVLDKLVEDKTFIMNAVIELVGGKDVLAGVIDSAKRTESPVSSSSSRAKLSTSTANFFSKTPPSVLKTPASSMKKRTVNTPNSPINIHKSLIKGEFERGRSPGGRLVSTSTIRRNANREIISSDGMRLNSSINSPSNTSSSSMRRNNNLSLRDTAVKLDYSVQSAGGGSGVNRPYARLSKDQMALLAKIKGSDLTMDDTADNDLDNDNENIDQNAPTMNPFSRLTKDQLSLLEKTKGFKSTMTPLKQTAIQSLRKISPSQVENWSLKYRKEKLRIMEDLRVKLKNVDDERGSFDINASLEL